MLTLYTRTGCPYCMKALVAMHELGLDFTEKDIADPEVAAELETRGGKVQGPYLIDDEHHVEMYESDDIVAYLHETFGNAPVE
jgi:glutaredoxin